MRQTDVSENCIPDWLGWKICWPHSQLHATLQSVFASLLSTETVGAAAPLRGFQWKIYEALGLMTYLGMMTYLAAWLMKPEISDKLKKKAKL